MRSGRYEGRSTGAWEWIYLCGSADWNGNRAHIKDERSIYSCAEKLVDVSST